MPNLHVCVCMLHVRTLNYMCVYILTYIHAHWFTCVYIYLHICMPSLEVYVSVLVCIRLNLHVCACIFTCTHAESTCVQVVAYMHAVSTCGCVYTFAHMHTDVGMSICTNIHAEFTRGGVYICTGVVGSTDHKIISIDNRRSTIDLNSP